jgi:hypothetical protein
MNRVMGGSLPARLWHEVMLAALEGRAPASTTLARVEKPTERQAEPLLPRERIGSQFVERVIGEDAAAGAAAAARPASAPQRWLRAARAFVRDLMP